jgi:hypothetical protein
VRRIEAVPILATGKPDYAALNALAVAGGAESRVAAV